MEISEIQSLLRDGDSFAAIEAVQREGGAMEIAARYQLLLSELYWKAHDLSAVIIIGRAGILFCLGQSLIAGASPEHLEKFRSFAKGFAYDIGSFTWPGWEEPGIDPTPDQLAVGRDCAQLNLRLAIELKKPPDRLAMAHWLVGAHALAAENPDEAAEQFQMALDILKGIASARALDLNMRGYLAIARLCKNPADIGALADFNEVGKQLQSMTDKDAESYLAQLHTARRMFCDIAE
jgi:hypothetical protein